VLSFYLWRTTSYDDELNLVLENFFVAAKITINLFLHMPKVIRKKIIIYIYIYVWMGYGDSISISNRNAYDSNFKFLFSKF
jgi:hypothetical protein